MTYVVPTACAIHGVLLMVIKNALSTLMTANNAGVSVVTSPNKNLSRASAISCAEVRSIEIVWRHPSIVTN